MRIVWLVFAGLLALMALVLPRLSRPATGPPPRAAGGAPAPVAAVLTSPTHAQALLAGPDALGDSVAAFGLAQRGTPYLWAGTSPRTGFDCSGFIMYTFARFGVAVPHSTALLIGVGRPVPRAEAAPGDIVVFTGTAAGSTEPGHAGIVLSDRGAGVLRFVHSSSARRESGVKVSEVEGTDYERRFLQVRRVLGGAATAGVAPASALGRAVPPATGAPVAALPARRVAVAAPAAAAGLPARLATRPTARRLRATAKAARKLVVRKAAARKSVSAVRKPAPKKARASKRPAVPREATKAIRVAPRKKRP